MEKSLAIVVVTYNSRRYLSRQIAALELQTFKDWRLVVFDNASLPEERPKLHQLPGGSILIQSERNIGFAGGNNRAVESVDSSYIALLNPDAFPEPRWLEELLSAADRWPGAVAFGSTQLRDEDDGMLDGAGDEMHVLGFPYRALHRARVERNCDEGECFSACAAAALYKRDLFLSVGGFDENFFCYCEDVDLGFRLRLCGHVTVQATEAVVRHVGGGGQERSSFAQWYGARNRVWCFVKNMPPFLFWAALVPHLIATQVLLVFHAASGRGFSGIRGFLSSLPNIGSLMEMRRASQAVRQVSSWHIAKAMVWRPDGLIRRKVKRRCTRYVARA